MVFSPSVGPDEYIGFLMASPIAFTCTSAAETHPSITKNISHDVYNRFLNTANLGPDLLYSEFFEYISKEDGYLIIDDTLLSKRWAKKIRLARKLYSGREHRVQNGICLITLLWTNGIIRIPIDYRIYDKGIDGKTKNQHFRDMVQNAHSLGFKPKCICFDSWFSGEENISLIISYNWNYFSRLKSNRLLKIESCEINQVKNLPLGRDGQIGILKNGNVVKCFKTKNKAEKDRFWFTNIFNLDSETRKNLQKICWKIEQYHRDIKSCCGIEKCQCRTDTAQINHITCSLCAFIRFELYKISYGKSCYQLKKMFVKNLIKDARWDLSMRFNIKKCRSA
jgi:putative transposase